MHPTQSALLGMDTNWLTLPGNLPEPTDDGLADHLYNHPSVPNLFLPSTPAGDRVNLFTLSSERPVLLFIYPRTGEPGKPNPDGWDDIPGARGCTPVCYAFDEPSCGLIMNGYCYRNFVLCAILSRSCKPFARGSAYLVLARSPLLTNPRSQVVYNFHTHS